MTTAVLWIPAKLITSLTEQAVRRADNETGGLLLGYTADRSAEVVVLDALGPGPNATHTPTDFEPDQIWQEQELASRYTVSDGLHSYVGDWHSHPVSPSVPSPRDRAVLRRIARYPAARLPNPIMLIIGAPLGTASVRAWRRGTAGSGLLRLWTCVSEIPIRLTD